MICRLEYWLLAAIVAVSGCASSKRMVTASVKEPTFLAEQSANASKRLAHLDSNYPEYFAHRCSLGVLFSNLHVVHKYPRDTRFKLGDRLNSLNGDPVTTATLGSVLWRLPPDGTITVEVERAGTGTKFAVPCTDAYDITNRERRILSAIADAQWDECLRLQAERRTVEDPSSRWAIDQAICVAGKNRWQQVSPLSTYDVARLLLDECKWDPQGWEECRPRLLTDIANLKLRGASDLATELGQRLAVVDKLVASDHNFRKQRAAVSSTVAEARNASASVGNRSIVRMERSGGTFLVPATLNDSITLRFVVDSGASDVVIPADVVLTLMRTETVRASDFLGQRTYVLADGSKMPSSIFRLRSLRLGDRVLHDVTASVGDVRGELLLGQSALGRFRAWSIDNVTHSLVLELP